MQASFRLSIGVDEEAQIAPQDYTQVKFDVEFHKAKIEEMKEKLQQLTGKFRVPAFTLSFPQSAKNLKLDWMETNHVFDYAEVQKNGRVIRTIDLKEKETIMMKKRIQKVFGKMNELDNNLFFHMDLYNIDSYHERLKAKEYYPLAVFMEKIKMEGKLSTDPSFYELLRELTQKLSPKFADSPLIAILPLLSQLQLDIEMQSLRDLEEEHQEHLLGFKRYEDPDEGVEEEKAILDAFKNKEKVELYIAFENLAILKIDLQVRMFAFAQCLT